MGILGIILLIILALFLFYKWIICVFVNFMNHSLVVPPQVGINLMLEGLNTPFCKMSKIKIFGAKPFKKIIPCPLIPYLDVKCIPKPSFYNELGYKDPIQCKKTKKKMKKKKKEFGQSMNSASTNIFFILVLLLFILLYIGTQKSEPVVGQLEPVVRQPVPVV